jgi:tRNA(fMet)-specific endonuclease VapC
MTGFMLDTDISSYIIKRRPATLLERFEKHAESLSVSVMTAAELRFGAAKAGRPKLAELVEAYLERLAILDWVSRYLKVCDCAAYNLVPRRLYFSEFCQNS